MYIAAVPELERRDGYPAVLAISGWIADNHNANGGKRPPKEPPSEPPLEPNEMYSAHEKLVAHFIEFAPPKLIRQMLEGGDKPHLHDVSPATAEGVIRAAEMGLFADEHWPLFSRDYTALVARAAQYDLERR